MYNHAFLMFLALFSGLVLLVLVTFSTPFIRALYFLQTSVDGGVKFGIFGYCYDLAETCTPLRFGYDFGVNLMILERLTKVLILFPAAAGLTLLALITLLPLLCFRKLRRYPHPLFFSLAILSFLTALAAFVVTIVLVVLARERLRNAGFTANFGPSVWMALAAVPVLALAALNAGCGTCFGGRFGRQSNYLAYNY